MSANDVPFDPDDITLPSEISRWPPCAPMMSINSSGWHERAATVDNNVRKARNKRRRMTEGDAARMYSGHGTGQNGPGW